MRFMDTEVEGRAVLVVSFHAGIVWEAKQGFQARNGVSFLSTRHATLKFDMIAVKSPSSPLSFFWGHFH